MSAGNLRLNHSTLFLEGAIDFYTVAQLRRQGEKAIAAIDDAITIDLAGVQKMDSSIASLLCCWHRFAKKSQKRVVLNNVSHSLQNLLQLYGIKNILTASSTEKEG